MERGALHPTSGGWLQSKARLVASADLAETSMALCDKGRARMIPLPFPGKHLVGSSEGGLSGPLGRWLP